MALTDAERIEWLSNDNHRIVLMDLETYDPTISDIVTERFSSYPYVMPIGDSWNTLSNLMYDDVLYNIPNIITKIDADSAIGTINIYNTDGEYDYLLDEVSIVGHSITLSIGEDDWIRENFIPILEGTVKAVSSSNPSNISLTILDKKGSLDVHLQPNIYTTNVGGTGYWDILMDNIRDTSGFTGKINNAPVGDADYDRTRAVLPDGTHDTHVPICLGKCFNIEPVLIDYFNHVYQVHEGPIVSIDNVRSNGILLGDTVGLAEHSMLLVNLSQLHGNTGFQVGEIIEDVSNPAIYGTVTRSTGTDGVDYTVFYTPGVNYPGVNFSSTSGTLEGVTTGITSTAVDPVIVTDGSDGQYEIDENLGVFRLLDHDQGTQITCDVEGQDGASSRRSGTAPTLVEHSTTYLLEWLLLEKGNIDSGDICYETFYDLGTDGFPNTDEVGFYSKSEDTVLNVTNKLINAVGGFMRFKSADCKMQVYLLDEPAGKDVDLTLVSDDIILNGLTILEIEEPKKSITLGYKKNWTVQNEGLAGSIMDPLSPNYDFNILTLYNNEYSTHFQLTGISDIEYPLAEDVDLIETTIFDAIEADAELTRRIALRNQRRKIFKIQSVATSFTYDIGDIVHITHDRFGFSVGVNAMIIGIEESPTKRRVNLEVWL